MKRLPELPEVETVRRTLRPLLVGRTILGVEVGLPRLVRHPSPEEFARRLAGRRVDRLERRGKYLLFRLAGGETLVAHLRMTGRLTVADPAEPRPRHTHLVFPLDDGRELRYQDLRQFGTFYLLRPGEEGLAKGLAGLGPEPLGRELDEEGFYRRLAGRRGSLKGLLLDQAFLAGLGNIYADEVLFAAGLDPRRAPASLSRAEAGRLFHAIRRVLAQAVRHRGTTVRDYVDGTGTPGGHQHHLQVYGRAGLPCPQCGEPVRRENLAGRGTHFCPRCQG